MYLNTYVIINSSETLILFVVSHMKRDSSLRDTYSRNAHAFKFKLTLYFSTLAIKPFKMIFTQVNKS